MKGADLDPADRAALAALRAKGRQRALDREALLTEIALEVQAGDDPAFDRAFVRAASVAYPAAPVAPPARPIRLRIPSAPSRRLRCARRALRRLPWGQA